MEGTVAEGKRKIWEFRAKTEEDRIRWVQSFLASTLQADYEIDENSGRDTLVGTDGVPIPIPPKKSGFSLTNFSFGF